MKMLSALTGLLFVICCSPRENFRPAPEAFFSWTNAGDGSIQFKSESTEADSYAWNFGDGSAISNEQSPKHSFTSNSTHSVTLTVTNPTASDKTTQEVDVATIKPSIDFIWSDTNGQVKFTNVSKNAESYIWDFGNGKTSLEANPEVRYTKAGSYLVKLTAKGKGGENMKSINVNVPTVVLELADVVDDPSLVNYLPGVWGSYVKGEGAKFDNYTYRFFPKSNTLTYQNYYHPYIYPSSDFQTVKLDYKYSIVDKTIYVEDASGKQSKHARIQIVSDDEMRVFRIIETSTAYNELSPIIFTRTSDVERTANSVVKSQSILSILNGIWDQGDYSTYKDVFFDFSTGANYYTYNYSILDTKNVQKREFKIDANNVMSYRNWSTDVDPAWKKYKIEIESNTRLKLYVIDANGSVNKTPDYTLTKRN
ncbi:hypothetical protein GCM10028807_11400 [Spirosoma daeguense]